MKRLVRGGTIAALLLLAAPAAADDAQEAREAFQQGKTAYLEGRCEDAIRFYEQAMKLKPSPKLHYNIGLAYEKLEQPAKALASFRAYLDAEPGAANAKEVRERIAALEKRPRPTPHAPVPVPSTAPAVRPRPAPQPLPQPVAPVPVAVAPPPGYGAQPGYYNTAVVSFASSPAGAEILVDGRPLGVTPQSLAMVAGAVYRVQMTRAGFYPEKQTVVAHPGTLVRLELKPTPEGRTAIMTRTEWFAFEPSIGYQSGGIAVGLRLIVAGLRWKHLHWTIAEGGGAVGSRQSADVGTRLGYPIYLGAAGQHELRFGVGLAFGGIQQEVKSSLYNGYNTVWQWGLMVSPSIEYRRQFPRRFFTGVGVRYSVVAVGELGGAERAHQVLWTVPLGWAAQP